MTTIVVDASAIVDVLVGSPRSAELTAVMRDKTLIAPELLDVEVCSALARLERASTLTRAQADEALGLYLELPVRRISHRNLRHQAWSLRHAVRIADAFYLACAIALDAPLLTLDRRLARSGASNATFVPLGIPEG
ncbi:MAG TPA: type II toxin-antitoxin system VapC family toxin [Terrimesophilobacter sp.]|nr:type II toxin-antitoxin system VapC family toxin [Terrimesophilobacter sp.]